MPTLKINGASLYYQILGDDLPKSTQREDIPILLIHGATSAGWEDWGRVAPILARKRQVILPDCRGHGRSNNPNQSYHFAEMAADLADLIRGLGYERAHIIGHSNGGNVALLMLVDHPEVIQTGVLQAANAYVDDTLRSREPQVFNPENIARNAPGWIEMMLRLHSPTHGLNSWRDLLAMTLAEILVAPNYSPQDLARVDKPVLAIQGGADPVNAPGRHAQFIARHIPYAECWIPSGAGHTVHEELTAEWLERVESFWKQRGHPAGDALHRLKAEAYPASREWIFDLQAETSPDQPGMVKLYGSTLNASQIDAAVERVAAAAGIQPQAVDRHSVQPRLTENTPWALANRTVIDLRREPSTGSERVSQVLLGEAVRVLEDRQEWLRVRIEHDGYLGWAVSAAFQPLNVSDLRRYQASVTHRVQAEMAQAWGSLELAGKPESACGKLPFAARAAVQRQHGLLSEIRLPDGRLWWVETAGLLPILAWPKSDLPGIEKMLGWFRRFVGVPYLWGGRTPFGYDCSGLSGTFWDCLGVPLRRDADQQFCQGTPVEGEPEPGDLLFFGEPDPDSPGERTGHITHVAIALGGGRVIHATGAVAGVTIQSLNPDDPDYRPWLRQNCVGARRYR